MNYKCLSKIQLYIVKESQWWKLIWLILSLKDDESPEESSHLVKTFIIKISVNLNREVHMNYEVFGEDMNLAVE